MEVCYPGEGFLSSRHSPQLLRLPCHEPCSALAPGTLQVGHVFSGRGILDNSCMFHPRVLACFSISWSQGQCHFGAGDEGDSCKVAWLLFVFNTDWGLRNVRAVRACGYCVFGGVEQG